MEILKKPVLTEKMTAMAEKLGRYAFIVDKRANKIQIKQAVEKMYGVTIESVNTMIIPGKVKTRGTKGGSVSGRTGSYKKAVVTLVSGSNIDFYSSI